MHRRVPLAPFALALAFACRAPVQPPPGADGATIYALQLCANCHGDAGEGTGLGPPLAGLAGYWERDRLAAFLADPAPFEATDERLARLQDEFAGDMDGYPNLSLAERLVLADHLLAR